MNLMSGIDSSSSVIWISQKLHLPNKIHQPDNKILTSPGLLDMTFFAHCLHDLCHTFLEDQ